MVNAAQVPFRMSSPTLEQMQAQLAQQQQQQQQIALGQQQPDIAALTAFANRQAKSGQQKAMQQKKGSAAQPKGSSKSKATAANSSRSPSPANLSNSRQNSQLQAGEGNLPLKASRHKYAEQRRRNRINERLDQLRTLVPHTEGSNIAGFLDQVIEYVMKLQQQLNIEPQGHQDQVVLPSVAQIKNLLNGSNSTAAANSNNDNNNASDGGDQAPAASKKRSSKKTSEDGEKNNKDAKKARKD
jgi:hypothetical protein